MQFMSKPKMFGSENQTWLGSRRGTSTGQTVTIDGTKLTAFAKEGFIPSGIPLKKSDSGGKFEPVAATSDVLAGFLLTSQSWEGEGDIVAPMLDTGRIRLSRLPEKAFDVTTLETASPHFVLVKEGEE